MLQVQDRPQYAQDAINVRCSGTGAADSGPYRTLLKPVHEATLEVVRCIRGTKPNDSCGDAAWTWMQLTPVKATWTFTES